jgi:hypothetical protein
LETVSVVARLAVQLVTAPGPELAITRLAVYPPLHADGTVKVAVMAALAEGIVSKAAVRSERMDFMGGCF